MTGNAVIDNAAAMNSANGQNATPAGASGRYSNAAMGKPSAIGTITDNSPMRPAASSCRGTPLGKRNSAPTMNMNSTRPSCDKPVEHAEAFRSKDARVQLGRERAEDDRTEHEARGHFADD